MRIISSASVEGLAKHLRLEIGEFYRGLKRIHVIDALDLSEAAGTGSLVGLLQSPQRLPSI